MSAPVGKCVVVDESEEADSGSVRSICNPYISSSEESDESEESEEFRTILGTSSRTFVFVFTKGHFEHDGAASFIRHFVNLSRIEVYNYSTYNFHYVIFKMKINSYYYDWKKKKMKKL